ncbi:MAG: MFS transporter [Acidobacteriota bacterium]|nr:MFS transporter [Acidobacteriota bacterium]
MFDQRRAVTTDHPRTLSKGLTFIMALAIGTIVANLYYLQPLLHQITRDFHVRSGRASLLMTLVQVGYALGLAFVVPLGDLIARRKLAVGIFALAAVMMALGATIHSFNILLIFTLILGLTTVGGQVLIPFAADLAAPEQRGRVIARVMTGLLLGILLSRTVSGLIAQAAGWRAVYWVAAAALVIMAVTLYVALPTEAPRPPQTYAQLVVGTFALFRELPLLRRRAYYGFLIFACNNVLWTPLSYVLAASPYHYSNAVIGLFGLFGVAGVLTANLAGHVADKQRTYLATIAFSLLLLSSFALLGLGRSTFLVLALGIVVLDAGMQGMQITNQSLIYALRPEARSRVNSVYMVSAFLGASAGSYLAGNAYEHFGWRGDCWLGALLAAGIVIPALWRREEPARANEALLR